MLLKKLKTSFPGQKLYIDGWSSPSLIIEGSCDKKKKIPTNPLFEGLSNIGSGDGLLPDGTKSSHIPMFTWSQYRCTLRIIITHISLFLLFSFIQVADPDEQLNSSISDVTYFLDRYPCLLPSGASRSQLELEFADYQIHDLSGLLQSPYRVDHFWAAMHQKKDSTGQPMFPILSNVMLSILCIPHSNASCERVFSQVRKNKTDQRASMGAETLNALMVVKATCGNPGERNYSDSELKAIKSAYYRSLNEK